jgi:hypothetical protein
MTRARRRAAVVAGLAGGNALVIAAELAAAKAANPVSPAALLAVGVYALAGLLVLPAYRLSAQVLGSGWLVAAIALGLIVVIEPVLILLWFGERPGAGSVAGFALGAAGLLLSAAGHSEGGER